jgi:hypothetical protein
MNDISGYGRFDLYLTGNVVKHIDYKLALGGSFGPAGANFAILDLQARIEFIKAANLWVGRILVPANRLSLSGPYHVNSWVMPGEYGGPPVGPKAGPDGRNNGAVFWGLMGKGKFKYYLGAFNLHNPDQSPLFSGRLQLALLDPEAPIFNQPDTYYGGKDILTLGVGGQVQRDGSVSPAGIGDYQSVCFDLLFEKNLGSAGVISVEASFYKAFGDYNKYGYSWFGLVGYLAPVELGPGKLNPVFRFHQAKLDATDGEENVLEAQLGYIIHGHDAKAYLGYQRVDLDGVILNQILLGIQVKM